MPASHFVIAICLICSGGSLHAWGQEIDDLFSQPTQRPTGREEIRAGVARVVPERSSTGQRPADQRLFSGNQTSGLRTSYEMAMHIRQSRALEAARQRTARMEAANWAGEFPSRPNWNPMSMMSTRYPTHNVVTIPAYYYSY